MTDLVKSVLDLIQGKWDATLTDNLTPRFIKTTELIRGSFAISGDWIIGQSMSGSQTQAGIGIQTKNLNATFNLDIRVHDPGFRNRTHYEKVVNHLLNIIDGQLRTELVGWDVLKADGGNFQDMSAQRRGVWRKIIPLKVESYAVQRGSINII